MNISFENKYVMDEKLMLDTIQGSRKLFTLVTLIPTIIAGLGILSVLARIPFQNYLDLPMLLRWLIGFLLLFLIYRTPNRTAHRVMKDVTKMQGGQPLEGITQFGDRILSNLGDPDGYAYDRITAVKSMKHCYVIYIDKKKSIPVLRDGFTRGDFESFKAFLKTKRPDLKIPK